MKKSHSHSGLAALHRQRQWQRLLLLSMLPFACAMFARSLLLSSAADALHLQQQPRHAEQQPQKQQQQQPADQGPNPEELLEAAGYAAAASAAMAGPDRRRPVVPPAESSLAGAPLPAQREKVFLFIGILSGRGYRHRRMAVRGAWASAAQVPGKVVARFVLSEDERTPQVEEEVQKYGDIIFVREKTDYKHILYKTFFLLEYASAYYDAAFVLKTDDDAFVNVQPLMAQLQALCEDPQCRNERLYLGHLARRSEVVLQPGHRWNNADFFIHTGLRQYPNYMMGGGYVLGGNVARVLVEAHARTPLRFSPIEDATVGHWLTALDLRTIDHPKFHTVAETCCFNSSRWSSEGPPGSRFRFRLLDRFEADMCSTDPWLVLHKIDSPAKMRFVGQRVANCTPAEPWVLPDSIEKYVSPDTRDRWAEQREAVLAAAGKPSHGGDEEAFGDDVDSAPAADAAEGAGDHHAPGSSSSSSGSGGKRSGGEPHPDEAEEQAHALDDDGHR